MQSDLVTMLDQRELVPGSQQGYQAYSCTSKPLSAIELRFRNGDLKQRAYANLAVDVEAGGRITLHFVRQIVELTGRNLRDRKFLDALLDRKVRWIAQHPDGLVRPNERDRMIIETISVKSVDAVARL